MRKILLGLTLGLVLAELAFYLRDGGAFTHLNLYETDELLGAHLQKDAETKIAFGGNPITTVRTNDHGLRGGPLPRQANTLVVGDSQVFGLGVEETDTFSSKLAELLGTAVVNAGVPTYGPAEYTAMIERLGPRLKPTRVVYVVNLANDLFELERANTERHAVWDGWAVRKETAPDSVTQFPGRRWLMSKSHLVYAMRGLLHRSSDDAAFSSEGTWKDIASAKAPASVPSSSDNARKTLDERFVLSRNLGEINGKLTDAFTSKVLRDEKYADEAKKLANYKGSVHDIVQNRFAEAARPVDHTAAELLRAALGMEKNAESLRKLAEEKKDKEMLALLAKRQELRGKLSALKTSNAAAPEGALAAALSHAQQVAAETGAQVLVVALPLDVQVSADEWKKYGRPPIDMAASEALATWVVQTAEALGMRALDATEALRAAEPGAFLNADLHMSPKGHAALAAAIAKRMAEEDRREPLALPAGRSWPPTQDEWAAVSEVVVKGSTAAHCETKIVREWFRMRCFSDRALGAFDDLIAPDGSTEAADKNRLGERPSIQLLKGGQGDAYVDARSSETALIAPLGEDIEARISWDSHSRVLRVSKGSMAFGEKEPGARPKDLIAPGALAVSYGYDQRCVQAKKGKGACEIDVPTRDPKCEQSEVVFGATRRCVRDCTSSNMCPAGSRCIAWQGLSGCVTP